MNKYKQYFILILICSMIGFSAPVSAAGKKHPLHKPAPAPELQELPVIDKKSLTPAQQKIDTALLRISIKMDEEIDSGRSVQQMAEAFSNKFLKIDDKGRMQVYVHYTNKKKAIDSIKSVEGIIDLVSEPMGLVQAWIAYDSIEKLAQEKWIKAIRRPGYAITRTGSVNSEGDAIHRSDLTRSIHGYGGKGIKVGVISDGINGITQSQNSGDIPSTYEARSARSDNNLYDGAEGTAMLEIVHDLAPEASLAFSNCDTSVEFIEAVNILDNEFDCDIICDDLGFLLQPYCADGSIAQRLNQLYPNGKLAVSAAGNDGDQSYYEGDFYATTGNIGNEPAENIHAFNQMSDYTMRVTIPSYSYFLCVLQWDDKFGSSDNDYDLYLVNSSNTFLYSLSVNVQNGDDDPLEYIVYENYGSEKTGNLIIQKYSGEIKLLKMIVAYGSILEYAKAPGSIYGHPAARDVIAVGAINQQTPGTIAPYSSQGPVTIRYPNEIRDKPEICGIDNVSVTGNGGFPSTFAGTSAAAPHVAAICAQIWSANPGMSNTMIKDYMMNYANDLGTPG
ncbi:MAG: S8 family serine peptidase, partial [Elusimicrobia bacterium]|nr:S8 family serine peptidase [Elusimicrobiota bacterium]